MYNYIEAYSIIISSYRQYCNIGPKTSPESVHISPFPANFPGSWDHQLKGPAPMEIGEDLNRSLDSNCSDAGLFFLRGPPVVHPRVAQHQGRNRAFLPASAPAGGAGAGQLAAWRRIRCRAPPGRRPPAHQLHVGGGKGAVHLAGGHDHNGGPEPF